MVGMDSIIRFYFACSIRRSSSMEDIKMNNWQVIEIVCRQFEISRMDFSLLLNDVCFFANY